MTQLISLIKGSLCLLRGDDLSIYDAWKRWDDYENWFEIAKEREHAAKKMEKFFTIQNGLKLEENHQNAPKKSINGCYKRS